MHLIVDGYGGDSDRLASADNLHHFLDTHPEAIGMTKIVPPQVYTYRGKNPEDWGLSGFVLIAESHISVHTFPDRAYINVDVFSCRDFETDASVEAITRTFGLSETKVWKLDRGLEFETPLAAYRGMVRERTALLTAAVPFDPRPAARPVEP